MGKKLVQFGAGNIGRSLVGQIFSSAGWEIVFVEVDSDIVEALTDQGRYRILVKEREPDEIWVEGVRGVFALETDDVVKEIVSCDLLSTAVGAKFLPEIAETIAKGLLMRDKPLNLILCENLRNACEVMKTALLRHLPANFPFEERVGLVATSIGKMVPLMPSSIRRSDPLEVWAEAYNQLIVDKNAFIGGVPDVKGVVPRNCFEAYVDQKLFVHNMGHALCAYLGDQTGANTICQAMENERTVTTVRKAMEESGEALVALYPQELKSGEMQEYIEDLLRRFDNPELGDTVFRVGRDRPRKYAYEDRLIGSLRTQRSAGVDSTHTLMGIAAGFTFSAKDSSGARFASDVHFDEIFKAKGVPGVLVEICGLDPTEDSEWFEQLESLVRK